MDGQIYHVMNKSIAGFKIFNSKSDFLRMINLLKFYQKEQMPVNFYRFNEVLKGKKKFRREIKFGNLSDAVTIMAYCIMPTHLHFVLQSVEEKNLSRMMSNILNSYTKYFNIKNGRKGPLWEGRFKKVLIEDDEQLLHLTRYVHLNPVTANLISDPRKWLWSSYQEYLGMIKREDRICQFEDVLDIDQSTYIEFVKDRISYQKELASIKNTFLDNQNSTS